MLKQCYKCKTKATKPPDIDMQNYPGFTAHFVFLDLLSYKYNLVGINLVRINVKVTIPTVNL